MSQPLASDILYDKRLQERFIRKGLLTRQQLDEWLAQLADNKDHADITDLDALVQSATQRQQRGNGN